MNKQIEIDFDAIDKEIATITKKTKAKTSTVEGDLKAFKAILNKKPTANMLKKNSFYGNMYIPIEIIERMLSALYLSYNFVMTMPPTVEEGNIIFYIDVILKHPVTGSTETFTGVSAVPIKPVNGTLRDIHPHIPAAKSFAIMNACKHIGRLFRAENDNITNIFDSYFDDKPQPEPSKEDQAKAHLKTRLLKMINASKTITSLRKKEKQIAELKDKEVAEAYMKREIELIQKI